MSGEAKAGVRIFDDLDKLSRAAADEFASLAQQSQAAGLPFRAALSGGSTPKRMCELLASQEFSSKVPWSGVHLFQVDERAVPPDSPESNYRMIREAMLSVVPLPAANFHRMKAESRELDAAASDYEAELRAVTHAGANSWPRLDLIYLGMGGDGHTASLFPGTPALSEETRAVSPNFVAQMNMWRMTMTRPVLNGAAHVIFLVSGEQKASMLRKVLKDPDVSPPLPAQLIRPSQGTALWYIDRPAAKFLQE